MDVIVLDGNENQAVACVRSLASQGHRVHVGASTSWSKAGWSRDATSTFEYPASQDDVNAFIACVVERARQIPGVLVLPLTERTTLPVSEHRDQFGSVGAKLVLPAHDRVLQAFDKERTTQLASSLGIPVPKTAVLRTVSEIDEGAKYVGFPAVLKPRSSEEVTPVGRVVATGAPIYARNIEEFRTAYATLRHRSQVVLAQEYIQGRGEGFFALMRKGEIRIEFSHRRIRDVRPTGSGSAVRVSTVPDSALREAALKVLRALEWHGVAMVEFIRKPDGTLVFLEVNGRFWNSLSLAVYAGADFPSRLAELAEKGDVVTDTRYRSGVRCRWLLGDLRHLGEVWKGAPPSFPGAYPGRFKALFDFMVPVAGTYHDNFTLRDPWPEVGDWLDFIFRRLPGSMKGRSGGKKDHYA